MSATEFIEQLISGISDFNRSAIVARELDALRHFSLGSVGDLLEVSIVGFKAEDLDRHAFRNGEGNLF